MPTAPSDDARDHWLHVADWAREKREEALARGDRKRAELWDDYERKLLGYVHDEDMSTSDSGAIPVGPDGQIIIPPWPPERKPSTLEKFVIDFTGFLNRNFPKEEKESGPSPGGRRW